MVRNNDGGTFNPDGTECVRAKVVMILKSCKNIQRIESDRWEQ
jgi:hypothetical protein